MDPSPSLLNSRKRSQTHVISRATLVEARVTGMTLANSRKLSWTLAISRAALIDEGGTEKALANSRKLSYSVYGRTCDRKSPGELS